MSISKKLSPQAAKKIREALEGYSGKVTIDLDKDTIELQSFSPYKTILEAKGTITPERAKELQEEVKRMREEDWG